MKKKPRKSDDNSSTLPAKEEADTGKPGDILARLEEYPKEEINAIIQTYMSGPLPPPQVLKEYKEFCPEAYEWILNTGNKNTEARIQQEGKIVDMEVKKTLRGQNYAFFLSVLAILGTVFCAYIDKSEVALALFGLTLLGLVSSFLGKKKDKGEEGEAEEEH